MQEDSERLESGKEAARERVLPQALPTLSLDSTHGQFAIAQFLSQNLSSWLSVAGETMPLTLTVQRALCSPHTLQVWSW